MFYYDYHDLVKRDKKGVKKLPVAKFARLVESGRAEVLTV